MNLLASDARGEVTAGAAGNWSSETRDFFTFQVADEERQF